MKRGWRRVLIVGILLAAAGGIFLGGRYLNENYILWNWHLLPRDSSVLDISGEPMGDPSTLLKCPNLRKLDARGTGLTVSQFEILRSELPECEILWEVPIEGSFYWQDTRSLTVERLTEEDIRGLSYLPGLRYLDVGRWGDYDGIRDLQSRFPEITLAYQVELGGEWWDWDSVSLLLESPEPEELSQKLSLFPKLESLVITGNIPSLEDLRSLQLAYPEVFFLWKMDVLGLSLETDSQELTVSDGSCQNVSTLGEILPYFPKLRRVVLNPCDDARLALLELAGQYPDIQFVFEFQVGDTVFSSEEEQMDISNTPMEDTSQLEQLLPLMHSLKKVVMCQCGLDSQAMDALGKRHPEIRFVWSVDLGGVMFRTDAVHFAPNRWGLKLSNENIYDLRYCTDMVCVDIGHNTNVTNCEWVKFMPKLKYLVLAETGISDLSPLENHPSLLFLELFLSKVKDYSILTTCKTLEDLNLCYTQGDPEPIGEMVWLKRLWWSGSWKARMYLKDKLPDTEKQFLSVSSTGMGWREGQHYYDMRDFIGMEYMTG